MTRNSSLLFTVAFCLTASTISYADHNTPEALESRVSAVGALNISDTASTATEEEGPVDGESVYSSSCATCHGAGIAGAPAIGDAGVWADRIAQGFETLAQHAIQGFTGDAGVMPAKGGNPALSDEAVTAAVQYMVDQSQ